MARSESKMVMGYLPIEPHHYPAILSLLAPATPATRILDPFAGEGAFLEAAAKNWNLTPYANELDGERTAECVARFGATQTVRCDVERLIASTGAFSLGWFNPPYDHDASGDAENKRIEFRYLKHAWKWIQQGGLVMWCVYRQHLTQHAAKFLATNSTQVDVWALPGKHQHIYDQIVVVARVGIPLYPLSLFEEILKQRENPRPLVVQPEPLYKLPPPPTVHQFRFMPDMLQPEDGQVLTEAQGAWRTNGFQSLLEVPAPPTEIEPVVAPRPGHLALVLAAGIADGAIMDTTEYGTVALRGKTEYVEQIARVEVEATPEDPDHQVKKTTMRLKPTTTLSLLSSTGHTIQMEGDEALLGFITANKKSIIAYLNTRFRPMYGFDFAGIGRWLDRVRLKGKYAMYTAQKHVVGAVVRGFQSRNSILLVGSMGTGKTLMGGSAAISIASGVLDALRTDIRPDQVVLLVAPPHLMDKWDRELHSIDPQVFTARLDRHEDVKAFMDQATLLGSGVAKIGLIKRDLTKLHCATEPAVVWRDQPIALWKHDAPTPDGYLPNQRVQRQKLPICPHCGNIIYEHHESDHPTPASESWLAKGRRSCGVCHTPLWQEARDRGSKPRPGEKYAPKNPRFRLDEYIKRFYRDRVYLLLWDEVHEAQHGDTGNGEAFNRMAGIAAKVLAMTGTPFNGRASSIFNIEYALNERVRQRYAWGGGKRLSRIQHGTKAFQEVVSDSARQRGQAESRWVGDMGVREQVLEERPSYDRETGVYTGTTTYERPYEEAPGISPLLIAEILDHTIFFSLGDLGKALPQYEEIALPVEVDTDVYDEYDRTRQQLKDYLVQCRWEGDATFRGAYLQWAMGWINAPHRPYEIVHNKKHLITGKKMPHVVKTIPSFGEDRIYAKEQALLDLVRDELDSDPTRPVVIYFRQTSTRDIQPRLEKLIRDHVPAAKTYTLSNTVSAERREKVIERQIASGVNVVLCNPELVKTGLDLIHFPTLIFYEIIFNLSTMMQASARSYRLNQTHKHCKVYYLFAEGTMEHTAVQLMSRKQRAAKLLTGDIGLTGLDALTEGESGFEEALLNAIGRDEALMDATEMFRVESRIGEIDAEDAAFWTVEQPLPDAVWDEAAVPLPAMLQTLALELGATLTPIAPREPLQAEGIAPPAPKPTAPIAPKTAPHSANAVREYLAAVCLLSNSKQVAALHAEILSLLATGTADDLAATLAEHRAVFPGFEAEVAARLVALHSAPQSEASTCPPEPLAEVTNTAPVALPSVKPPVPIAPTPMKVRPAAGRAAKTVSDIVQPLLFADLRESEAAHPAPHTDRVNDPFAAIDPREQWYQARAQLQLQLDRAGFEHLRTMEFVRLEGQTYHFVEQRAHALKQLQGKLGREVQRVLRDVIGNNVDVMFEIPELPTEGVPKPDKVETSAARGAYYQRDVEQYGQPTKVNGMEIFVVPNDPNKTIVWQTVGGTQYRQSVDTGKVLYVVGFDHTETIAA